MKSDTFNRLSGRHLMKSLLHDSTETLNTFLWFFSRTHVLFSTKRVFKCTQSLQRGVSVCPAVKNAFNHYINMWHVVWEGAKWHRAACPPICSLITTLTWAAIKTPRHSYSYTHSSCCCTWKLKWARVTSPSGFWWLYFLFISLIIWLSVNPTE